MERHIVHARGVPACGKSTLARAFEVYMRWKEPNLRTLLISWGAEYNIPGTYYDNLSRIHKSFFNGMQSSKAMTTQRYLLIVDEAQESYVKQDFWIDYLKTVSDTPSQDLP